MKLRIRGNLLRLRLNQSEVETFYRKGIVSDSISFGVSTETDQLTYSVETSWNDKIHTLFLNGKITVFVPQMVAKNWVESDQVSLEAEQIIDNNSKLRILVEKDFVCLNPRENEDASDNFAHPNQDQKC